MQARLGIATDSYCKIINIEAKTMLEMVRRDILPAIQKHRLTLARDVADGLGGGYDKDILDSLTTYTSEIYEVSKKLDTAIRSAHIGDAFYFKNEIIPLMNEIRKNTDAAEVIMPRELWPYPTYGDLLFGI